MNTADVSHGDYLAALASKSPTPGGGAAAALIGSQAAALVSMVAELSRSEKLIEANTATHAKDVMAQYLTLADEDSAAFNDLMKAYKQKEPTEDKLQRAATPPLGCLALTVILTEQLRLLSVEGNKNLMTDTAIAALLTRDCIEASELNLLINLRSIKDETFTDIARQKLEAASALLPELSAIAADIREQLL